MIPYISLAFMGGFLIGFGICRDLIKQELKFLGMVVGNLFYGSRSRIRFLRRAVSRKTAAD